MLVQMSVLVNVSASDFVPRSESQKSSESAMWRGDACASVGLGRVASTVHHDLYFVSGEEHQCLAEIIGRATA